MNNLFLVHVDEPIHYLFHQVLELGFGKHNLFPLLKNALQVELDELENQVDGLTLATHDINKLNDIWVSFKLFKHFDFSKRGYRKAVLLVLHFYFLKRVNFVANFSSVDFSKCSFVDKLFFFENFGRV